MTTRHAYRWVALALVSLASTAPLYAECQLPAKRPFEQSTKPREAIDTAAFIRSATFDLGEDLMGYAVILQGKQGNIIASATYGYARTPCEDEGAKPFGLRTQTAWGSVTKMITTAAVIDKVERSNARSLDEKMVDFLPARWRPKVHSGHREVTIRHLLSHQSGFAAAPEGVDRRDLLGRLERKPEKTVGKREYSNAGFAIFQYMGRFFQSGRWDEIDAGYAPGEIDYDSYVLGHSMAMYRKATRERIFEPLKIEASCNDVDYAGNNYAHFYESSQSKKGYHLNPDDKNGCPTGGIVMSPTDMGKFLYALARTDELVSRANYEALLNVPNENVLGWNGHVRVADGEAFYKAGGRNLSGDFIPGNSASGSAGAYIIAFPNGMTALVVINSRRPEGMKGLRGILVDAYNSGLGRAPKRTSSR